MLLPNARANVSAIPITSPVERISGPRIVSTPGNFANGKTLSFTATWRGTAMSSTPSSSSVLPDHHLRGDLRERAPRRLRHERHRARRARVHLEDVDRRRPSPRTARSSGRRRRARARACASAPRSTATISGRERVRRQHARRVAGVDAGLLDVLHHAADDGALAVGRRSRRRPRSRPSGTRRRGSSACRRRARPRPRAATYASSSSRVYAIIIARPPST